MSWHFRKIEEYKIEYTENDGTVGVLTCSDYFTFVNDLKSLSEIFNCGYDIINDRTARLKNTK